MFFNFALRRNFRPNSILLFQVTQSLHNWICRQVQKYEENKGSRGCQGRYIALIRWRQTAYRKLYKKKRRLLMYRSMHVCLALVVEDVTAWLERKMSIRKKGGRCVCFTTFDKKGISSFQKLKSLRTRIRERIKQCCPQCKPFGNDIIYYLSLAKRVGWTEIVCATKAGCWVSWRP